MGLFSLLAFMLMGYIMLTTQEVSKISSTTEEDHKVLAFESDLQWDAASASALSIHGDTIRMVVKKKRINYILKPELKRIDQYGSSVYPGIQVVAQMDRAQNALLIILLDISRAGKDHVEKLAITRAISSSEYINQWEP